MQFLVKGEFVEQNIAGKPAPEAIEWIERVIHPSLEMLEKALREGKVVGGLCAGVREVTFFMDAASGEEIGRFLRSLPFWAALRWTVTPIQSFKSAIEQDETAFQHAKAMMATAGHR